MKADRNERKTEQFLEFIVRAVPRLEAPPFFASRVSNVAQVEKHSFAGSLQAFSRRMIPAFMALLPVVCFGVYQWKPSDPLIESAAFYEEEYFADSITLEFVVDSLTVPSGEGNEDH